MTAALLLGQLPPPALAIGPECETLPGGCQADIEVTGSAQETSVSAGSTIHYQFVVKYISGNTNNATGVGLTVNPNTRVRFDSVTTTRGTCSITSGNVGCSIGSLPKFAQATVDIVATATGGFAATAKGTGSADDIDPNTANNTAAASVSVSKVTPTITTTPSAGGPIGTVVTDTATVSGGFNPSGTVTFSLFGPADPNCAGTPVFTDLNRPLSGGSATSNPFTTTQDGVHHWVATYNGDAANNIVSSLCANEPVTITAVSDLAVTPSGPAAVAVGSAFQHHFLVTNQGGATAPAVAFSATLANNATFNGASHSTGPCSPPSPGSVSCSLGDLAASATSTVTVSYTAATLGIATTTGTATTSNDANTANNTSSQTTTVTAPQTFTVTNMNDSGAGSLRQAILDANANPNPGGQDTIAFNIAGTAPAPFTIKPATPLPAITDPVVIDAQTQTGWTAGHPVVELDGSLAGTSASGFTISSSFVTIRGFVINRFSANGIVINSGGGGAINGNLIGTNVAGTTAAANGTGIQVQTTNWTIGGLTSEARNVISGNTFSGIDVTSTATSTVIVGNYIGVDATGNAKLANGTNGVLLEGNSNFVGGTAVGAGNVISGNGAHGIGMLSTASGNVVQGNLIGTNASGTAAIGNASNGIQASTQTLIGGTSAAARNVIAGNALGVGLTGGSNTVQGNYIGTNTAGTGRLGNSVGIAISLGGANLIGGTVLGAGNVISGNNGYGIHISESSGNTIQGNLVGVDATGTLGLGNGVAGTSASHGILVFGSSSNLIGGSAADARNVISSNTDAGVMVTAGGLTATNNTIQGNLIGLDVNGAGSLGNAGWGVGVSGANNTTIKGNFIANNGLSGVSILAGTGNLISENSIFSNTGMGIDLGDNGVTPNDAGDADTGANNLQNFPVVSSATTGSSTTIAGSLNTSAKGNFRIEFFTSPSCDASGHGEGKTFLAAHQLTTDVTGNASFNLTFPTNVSVGHVVTATATDPSGNTSEFSACQQVVPAMQAFFNNLAGFNAAAGSPPIRVGFDQIKPDTDITGHRITTATFQKGDQPAPSASLVVVRGSDTFTPAGFTGVVDANMNKLFATSGQNVLSPGGRELAPGPNAAKENDDLALTFDPPVAAVGFDLLFQSKDCCSFVGITVFDAAGNVLLQQDPIPTSSTGTGGDPGGAVFVGFVSGQSNIAKIVINEYDEDNVFPDSNIGFDTFRFFAPAATFTPDAVVPGGTLTVSVEGFAASATSAAIALVDPTGQNLVASLGILSLTSGSGSGAFVVPNTVPLGDYKVRATTNPVSTVSEATLSVVGPKTFVVNTTNDADDGTCDATHCSLREAIKASNANPAHDTIAFNIAGTGPHTISPTSTLPPVANPAFIDGFSQPGSSPGPGSPQIVLSGSNLTAGVGIAITGGNSTVQGLVIHRFPHAGIHILTNGGNTIRGNFIGTDPSGNAGIDSAGLSYANDAGVVIESSNNTIGGTTGDARNVISGNTNPGVLVLSGTNNAVLGNYIGTKATGTAAIGNRVGVNVEGSNNNTIGGTTAGSGNLISGNLLHGIRIAQTTGNVVQGNLIGTNAAGTGAVPNGAGGSPDPLPAVVLFGGAKVGGSEPGATNVISGNAGRGVAILGPGGGNVVQGNYIGTTPDGATALGNAFAGVFIGDSPNNQIKSNVLSANLRGVRISGPGATGNLVAGNRVGTNALGTAALGNRLQGVFLDTGASSNTIGGTASGAGNLISGNGVGNPAGPGNNGFGIFLLGPATSNNVVQGNLIGTEATGTLAMPNLDAGIAVNGAQNTLIGGSVVARNVIAGGAQSGVAIFNGAGGTNVFGNYIGIGTNGAALGNAFHGVNIVNASNNTVGDGTADGRNAISNNGRSGVRIFGTSTGNRVKGNYIGTNADGTAKMPNALSGVFIESANGNTVGGTAPGEGNLLSGNTLNGVTLFAGAANNLIQGNLIGTDATATSSLANGGHGVEIKDASNNTIGGTVTGAGNVIAFNTKGVIVVATPGFSAVGNAIRGNSIHDNTNLGIDLRDDGPTANDGPDADTGPNNLQNFPIIQEATTDGTNTFVSFTLETTANTNVTLQFFDNPAADPSGFGEGKTLIKELSFITAANGVVSRFTVPASSAPLGHFITSTATATSSPGDTSEFSAARQIQPLPATLKGTAQCGDTLLPGATVELLSGSTVVGRTTAGADGSYSFAVAPNSTFTVRYTATVGGVKVVCSTTVTSGASGVTTVPTAEASPYEDPGNIYWTRALPLTSGVSRRDRITKAFQNRYYRIAICPGCRIRVVLDGLPQDYNLFLYGDIAALFANLTTRPPTLDELRRLNANAIDEGASLGADEGGSLGVDEGGSLGVDEGASLGTDEGASLGTDEGASLGADEGGSLGVDEGASLGAAEAAQVFSSAQELSLLAFSVNPGLSPELIVRSTHTRTGDFYIRVLGAGAVNDPARDFTVAATVESLCNITLAKTAPTSAKPLTTPKTLILTNTARLTNDDGSPLSASATDVAAFLDKLNRFAGDVGGVVVNLAGDTGIMANFAQWDQVPGCVAAANIVVDAIHDLIDAYRDAGSGNLEYIVLAAGDRGIPYPRRNLREEAYSEKIWAPPVLSGSASRASLDDGAVLTDDCYAARGTIDIIGRQICPPGSTVTGRLVETRQDMERAIDAYIMLNGVSTAKTSLHTGYSFLEDGARALAAELRARGLIADDELIEAEDLGPSDPTAWSADRLRAKLFRALTQGEARPFDIITIYAHFHANRMLAADYRSRLLAREIYNLSDDRLQGALAYSPGCHEGYSIARGDAVPGVTDEIDFSQSFVRQGATLLANTGYGYGGSRGVFYSERLLKYLTQELGFGSGAVPIGKALLAAKNRYLSEVPAINGVDLKVVAELTIYGLPMMSFDLGTNRAVQPAPETVTPTQKALGFATADITSTPTLTRHDVTLPVVTGGTVTVSFFDADGLFEAPPYRPVRPVKARNAQASGFTAAGALVRDLTYTDIRPFRPLSGMPAAELPGVYPNPVSTVFEPSVVVVLNQLAGESVVFTHGQYLSDGLSVTGTERLYSSITATAYYVNASNPSFLGGPPALTDPSVSADGAKACARVTVSDAVGTEIHEVLATHTGPPGTTFFGRWRSLALTAGPTTTIGALFTRTYSGCIDTTGTGAKPSDLQLFFQAGNLAGRVARLLNGGRYYSVPTETTTVADPKIVPSIVLQASPTAVYGSIIDVTVTATDSATKASLGSTPVVLRLGPTTLIVKTGATGTPAAGVATAKVTVEAEPGTATLSASIAESADLAAAARSQTITVTRAPTTATVHSPSIEYSDSAPVVTLSGAGAAVIKYEPVIIDLGALGTVSLLTDSRGQVILDTLDFGGLAPRDGSYSGFVRYDGNTRFAPPVVTSPPPLPEGVVPISFTVLREKASITPSATMRFAQATPSAVLEFDVAQETDQAAGDITKAIANFTLTRNLQTTTLSAQVGADGKVRTTTPPLADGRYDLQASVSGFFTSSPTPFSGKLVVDTTAPTTMATTAPTPTNFGWNNGTATVTLTAVDGDEGSGVKELVFTIAGAQTGGGTVTGASTTLTITAEGITTISFFARDNVGNQETPLKTHVVNIDRTAPVVNAAADRGPDSNGWYNHPFTVTATGTDPAPAPGVTPSGIDKCDMVTYSGPDTATGSPTVTCTDKAGNVGAAAFAFKYDATKPEIAITAPADGATYVLNQAAAASYTCTDNLSGVATCQGPVPSTTGNVATSAVGSFTFTVNATDVAANANSRSTTYVVKYDICLLYDPTKAVRSGATLPIKIQLCDVNKANVSSSTIVVHALSVTQVSAIATFDVIDAGNANPDNDFRFDATLGVTGGYIFNLKTTGLATGTYELSFTAGAAPTVYAVQFQVR